MRTALEMVAVLRANPFPKAEPKYTYAIFLDDRPPSDALDHAVGQSVEKMVLGDREIFVHYSNGMGRSKLRIPAARMGTARNMLLNWQRSHLRDDLERTLAGGMVTPQVVPIVLL